MERQADESATIVARAVHGKGIRELCA